MSKNLWDKECHTKQRQGLIQWAWDSDVPFTDTQRKKNLKRLQRHPEVSLEGRIPTAYLEW